jgi:hypothetical protein
MAAMRFRWYQFRLRTLLIGVALFCVAVGYLGKQAAIVRARLAWLAWRHGDHTLDWVYVLSPRPKYIVTGDDEKSPSILRRLLGDERVGEIEVARTISDAELRDIVTLFPEATIYFDERVPEYMLPPGSRRQGSDSPRHRGFFRQTLD